MLIIPYRKNSSIVSSVSSSTTIHFKVISGKTTAVVNSIRKIPSIVKGFFQKDIRIVYTQRDLLNLIKIKKKDNKNYLFSLSVSKLVR